MVAYNDGDDAPMDELVQVKLEKIREASARGQVCARAAF